MSLTEQQINWTQLVQWWESGSEDWEQFQDVVKATIAALPAREQKPVGELTERGRFVWNTDGGPDKWRDRQNYQGPLYAHPDPDSAARIRELEADRLALATAIESMAVKIGIIDGSIPLTGPHLLMICKDISDDSTVTALKEKLRVARGALKIIGNTKNVAKALDADWCAAATGMVRQAKEALATIGEES